MTTPGQIGLLYAASLALLAWVDRPAPGRMPYAAGLAASALLDWSTVPAIVVALAVVALLGRHALRVAAMVRQR
ncbi:MAG TPA: hypothetical protein VIN38_01050 [Thiobacillus sp.]